MENRTMSFTFKHARRLLGATLIAAACVAAPVSNAAEKAVIYQAFQSIQYLPLYVAMNEGLFTKHGLEVQKVTAGGGAQGVAAVIGGHADFSLQDPMTAVLANLKGASLVNVAMVVSGVPVWMVAPPNSPIKSIADLKDQTISAALPPSTSTYLLQNLLKEKGLSNVKLNTVSIGTEISPVTAGRAAAAMLDQKIYPATPSISKQAFQAGLDLQISIGNIKAGEVTYDSAVDNSFAEKVSK